MSVGGEVLPSTVDRIDFRGRTAVVTGAGARGDGIGNGRAAALLLARAGADVVVVDRDEEAGHRTVEMVEQEGGSAVIFVGDVTREEDCAALATYDPGAVRSTRRAGQQRGHRSAVGSVVETEPALWDRVMKVNVRSMYLVSRALIPAMAEAGGGAIVNISSISAIRPKGLTAYSTSKGAVIALTKAMAVDHARDGIRVNAVLPGPGLDAHGPTPDDDARTPRATQERVGSADRGHRLGRWAGSECSSPPSTRATSPARHWLSTEVSPCSLPPAEPR